MPLLLDGKIVNVHPESWLTAKGCPPAVIVPVRTGPALSKTSNVTDPVPVPDEVFTMIHGSVADAVHGPVDEDAFTVKL